MKSKWINLAITCGIAVTFATGCASNRGPKQPKPNTRDILRNRELVPPPFSSPDAVKGFSPAPSSPAAPGMNAAPRRATAPVAPGNVAFQDSPQPALPSDMATFVPAADNGEPTPAVTSLFQDSSSTQPKLVAVTTPKGPASSEIINRPVRPATITPSVVKPTVSSPTPGTITPPGTTAPAAGAAQRSVIVKAGDTLSGIAYQYGISWQSLASANGLSETSKLRIGQKLVLPSTALAKPRPPQTHTQKSETKKTSSQSSSKAVASTKDGTYSVKAGDSLWTIAKAHNIKFSDIQSWNPSAVDKPLKIGQIIIIKAPAGASDKAEAKPETKPEAKKTDDKQTPKVVTPIQAAPAAPAKSDSAATVIGTGIINVTPAPQKADDGNTSKTNVEEENLLTHTVVEGDTLDKIALMYGANTPAEVAQKVNEIKAKNPTIQSDKDLKVGIIIRVPYTPVLP
ncbi:MAG: LysM peptidoglycan-binding domain-containing protein [Victivallales bacterium]|nr:LysM peptidoglycan-binding domain-containing protein [Victivallales bacterium]